MVISDDECWLMLMLTDIHFESFWYVKWEKLLRLKYQLFHEAPWRQRLRLFTCSSTKVKMNPRNLSSLSCTQGHGDHAFQCETNRYVSGLILVTCALLWERQNTPHSHIIIFPSKLTRNWLSTPGFSVLRLNPIMGWYGLYHLVRQEWILIMPYGRINIQIPAILIIWGFTTRVLSRCSPCRCTFLVHETWHLYWYHSGQYEYWDEFGTCSIIILYNVYTHVFFNCANLSSRSAMTKGRLQWFNVFLK
jgi:hypothetical protein